MIREDFEPHNYPIEDETISSSSPLFMEMLIRPDEGYWRFRTLPRLNRRYYFGMDTFDLVEGLYFPNEISRTIELNDNIYEFRCTFYPKSQWFLPKGFMIPCLRGAGSNTYFHMNPSVKYCVIGGFLSAQDDLRCRYWDTPRMTSFYYNNTAYVMEFNNRRLNITQRKVPLWI